jgi:hypothetical protein
MPPDHWWDRVPALLLVFLAFATVVFQLSTGAAPEALFTLAGVLVGAGIVLEAIRRR